jgi:hypothetical protein
VGEADDCFLLLLEYIPGGTLADRLSGPLTPTIAARLMETIARAVHHIHRHGQLHASQRRSGRFDEARRAAERMDAFARLLVTRYPRQSAAHLALCASFTQMAKHSWHPFDRAAVERNWKLALDEARRALEIDPQNNRAAAQVADLQKRLDLLLASKPSPQDSSSSPPTAGEAGR